MTQIISKDAVDVARLHIEHAPSIARASQAADIPYYVSCALVEGETGGDNVFGHDVGGALSTANGPVTVGGRTYLKGSSIPVTPTNYAIFLMMLAGGAKSNGVGVTQVTYFGELPDGRTGGYHRLAAEMGLKLWVPGDNVFFSLSEIFGPVLKSRGLREAFGSFNGGPNWRRNAHAVDYANRGVARTKEWQERLAGL